MLIYRKIKSESPSFSLNALNAKNISSYLGGDKAVSYVQATQSLTNYFQSSLIKTDNPLNVAIEYDGFFAVNTQTEIRYTRNGNFHVNGLEQLVNKSGNIIMTRSEEPILIPFGSREVAIAEDNSVFSNTEIDSDSIRQIKIVKFDNPQNLEKKGEGFYKISNDSVKKFLVNDAKILQNFTETSNANAIQEMTKMIETVRQLESYQKIIQSIDGADDQSVNSLGRVA